MKYTTLLGAAYAVAAGASVLPALVEQLPGAGWLSRITTSPTERYLIELEGGETRWISEDVKWQLRRVCLFSMRLECELTCWYRKG